MNKNKGNDHRNDRKYLLFVYSRSLTPKPAKMLNHHTHQQLTNNDSDHRYPTPTNGTLTTIDVKYTTPIAPPSSDHFGAFNV